LLLTRLNYLTAPPGLLAIARARTDGSDFIIPATFEMANSDRSQKRGIKESDSSCAKLWNRLCNEAETLNAFVDTPG